MPLFLIRYHIGTFAGLRRELAVGEPEAIEQAKAWARTCECHPVIDDSIRETYRVVVSHTSAAEAAR